MSGFNGFLPIPFMWLIEGFVERMVRASIVICFWFALCHRLGIIQRIIHRLVEVELSKLMNGCRVTMSRIEFDILSGSFVVYDGIIHSPSRELWKWDSPLVARFGRVTGKLNLFSIIDPLSYIMGYTWRDIHYVICDDIQVFVEKRRNIFNFHLLDESLDIPIPPELLVSDSTTVSSPATTTLVSSSSEYYASGVVPASSLEEGVGAGAAGGDAADLKANEIVSSVFKTVSQLGKAAASGNSSSGQEELTNVFKSHRDGLVTKLREFQEQSSASSENGGSGVIDPASGSTAAILSSPGKTAITSPSTTAITTSGSTGKSSTSTTTQAQHRPSSTKSIELFAKESLKVVKSMSKAVERNVTEIQQSLKPPEKKKGYKRPKEDLLRIGFLVFRDIRVFTKDVILSSGVGGGVAGGVGQSPSNSSIDGAQTVALSSGSSTKSSIAKWSKPILLKEVMFESKELCSHPPNVGIVKDEYGLPQIGISPERLVDILVRRALAEMAKTNTGRVFNNAVSEVFAWMDSVGSANSGGSNTANALESP